MAWALDRPAGSPGADLRSDRGGTLNCATPAMTWITTSWDLWSWGLLAQAVLAIPALLPVLIPPRRHLVARAPSRIAEGSPRRTAPDPGEVPPAVPPGPSHRGAGRRAAGAPLAGEVGRDGPRPFPVAGRPPGDGDWGRGASGPGPRGARRCAAIPTGRATPSFPLASLPRGDRRHGPMDRTGPALPASRGPGSSGGVHDRLGRPSRPGPSVSSSVDVIASRTSSNLAMVIVSLPGEIRRVELRPGGLRRGRGPASAGPRRRTAPVPTDEPAERCDNRPPSRSVPDV